MESSDSLPSHTEDAQHGSPREDTTRSTGSFRCQRLVAMPITNRRAVATSILAATCHEAPNICWLQPEQVLQGTFCPGAERQPPRIILRNIRSSISSPFAQFLLHFR
ncbi:uncharacterized protein LOC120679806 isoform X2 [Panicum virgatum]|uniref:uncharacterized protein LOC120679806 isoform X2 n=2 Tax=Panicum virgatum TaxID=38727 RepID=UPI0019D67C57|nr:uncharacterized protein LOC120679806 isoform X2 [Panicum virgatum]